MAHASSVNCLKIGRKTSRVLVTIGDVADPLSQYKVEDPFPMYASRDDAFKEERMAMLEEGNKKAMRCTCH